MSFTEKVKVKKQGEKTRAFFKKYENGLNRLYKRTDLPPGMSITLASNDNLHGENMNAKILSCVDYSQGFEVKEDVVLYQKFLSAINRKNGEIEISPPVRIKIGDFVLQYNFIRGLRPRREARRVDVKLDERPKKSGFNYAIPECEPEVFHTQKIGKRSVDFLYNRYPFAPFHFLWIPDRKKVYQQFLDEKKDEWVLEEAVAFVTESGMGSVRLSYNSLGAHASVNHLHKQGFFITKDWEPPIEEHIRQGTLESDKFYFKGTRWIPKKDMVKGLVECIGEMNERYFSGEKVSYCFYLTPKGAAFFPRKTQADPEYFKKLENARMDPERAPFTTGYAFFEMLGEIICPDNTAISVFDDPKVASEKIRGLYDALSLEK